MVFCDEGVDPLDQIPGVGVFVDIETFAKQVRATLELQGILAMPPVIARVEGL